MNIKDIARLAGVSASTVSKIINGKDESISAETIAKVLQIVKEYNYAPYDNIRAARSEHSFLLGALISDISNHQEFLNSILTTARENGYSTIVCISQTPEEEYKNLSTLINHDVDGILWNRIENSDPRCLEQLKNSSVRVQMVNAGLDGDDNTFLDYGKLGYEAMETLLEHKHRNLLCLTDDRGPVSVLFLQGCQKCLYDHQLPASNLLAKTADGSEELLVPHSVTGVACYSSALALRVAREAHRTNRRLPKYLSVIALDDGDKIKDENIAYLHLPYGELGRYVCRRLIANLEGQAADTAGFQTEIILTAAENIDVPITCRNKKIVVVGTLNVDTLLTTNQYPQTGETLRATSRTTTPGGKGINQAIGASNLGAEVYLIGKVGKDYESSMLFHVLQQSNVNTDGIFSTSKADTGHAYIYIQKDGESGIVIYDGANSRLTKEEVSQKEQLFENASFCLLQTEIRQELVLHVAKLAKRHGCQIILKPAAIEQMDDELVKQVDILLPNEKEMHTICPGPATLEEKAQYFLDRGVKTVIVTLGSKGGYYRNAETSEYFPAADFTPVDTTGAADAFCATLAVYLSENYDLRSSIRHANMAAGYSTTHYGAAYANAIDKTTLDFMMGDQ